MNANNNLSKSAPALLDIVIPKVSRYTSPRYIASIFYDNKIAMVRHVKLEEYKFSRGDVYKRAIIQLACWFNSPVAENIKHKIQTLSFARTIHKDENAWTLMEATDEDKNKNCAESVFFKMQNINKFKFTFKGEVQEIETVHPVFTSHLDNIQYVYYKEPKLMDADIDWKNKKPNDVIYYMSNVCEVLEQEDKMIIDGLKHYMKHSKKRVHSPKYVKA